MSLTKEQQIAVESIDRNVLVSAGAGSGKTHVLVKRYLEILRRNPKLSPGNIIAVTYTRKAAHEMRSRLKEEMETLSRSQDRDLAERWQACLAELDAAKIGTIHSLCESILKAFPEEAVVDPAFSVLDEMEGAQLLNESLEEVLHEAVAASSEVHDFLTGYPVDAVRKYVSSLVKSPITFLEAREKLGAMTKDDFQRVFAEVSGKVKQRVVDDIAMDREWQQLNTILSNQQFKDEANKLEQYRQQIVKLVIGSLGDGSAAQRFECLKQIVEIKVGNSGGNSEEAKQLRESLKGIKNIAKLYLPEFDESLNESDLNAIACLKALAYLADRVLESYKHKKGAKQKLDFNDQIMRVSQLLAHKTSRARQHYNQSIAAILIDEFQDTNSTQAEILESLLGPNARLFLIGDDKQSIYKFQGAEVETFNSWRKRITEVEKNNSDGLLVELNTSFRSHPEIVGFVNYIFSRLLEDRAQDKSPDYRAHFQSLLAHRSDPAITSRVEIVAFDAGDEEGQRINLNVRSTEAQTIACWIMEKMQAQAAVFEKATATTRPITFGDFAVLVQERKDFASLEKALTAQNIPYITVAGSGLLHTQEIYDLESALSFLWCPEDSHALMAVLRSPLVGVGDDVIQQLMVNCIKNEHSLWQQFKISAPEEFGNAVTMLDSWLKRASAEPVGRLVQAIIADSKYETILLSLPTGKQRSRNVWKFLQLSFDHNHMPIGDFLAALASMRDLNVKQSGAPLDMGDSVKLMTIHASKGLEFPAVILPVLDGRSVGNSTKLIFHRQFGLAFDSTRSKSEAKPSLYAAANAMERDMQIAEKKRLFYVAATRSRDYLSLFIESAGGEKTSFAEWTLSVLDIGEPDGADVQIRDLGTDSKIQIRHLASESLKAWQAKLGFGSTTVEHADIGTAVLNSQMLEPMSFQMLEPEVDFQHLSRITPASQSSIAPTVLGQFFHLLMQSWQVGWSKIPDEVFKEIAQHKEIRAIHPAIRNQLIEQSEQLVEKFVASDLYSLWQSAIRRFHEMPYMIMDQSDVYARRPDLLLEDKSGQWHIVDFKTDHFDIAEIDRQTESHQNQLKRYVRDIEALTGIRARASVYFAQHGLLREIVG